MEISLNGLALIKKFEGLRLKIYGDALGLATIGYGHLIQPGENFDKGITLERAEQLLGADASKASESVNDLVKVPINQNQFDALVDFVFNLGPNNFSESTLLKELNSGNYVDAANQFKRWVYAGNHVMSQLIARREAEQALFWPAL